jgi:hypothetical protein
VHTIHTDKLGWDFVPPVRVAINRDPDTLTEREWDALASWLEETFPLDADDRSHGFAPDAATYYLDDMMTVAEAAKEKGVTTKAVYNVLRNDERREAIFPRAHKTGEGTRGTWHLHPEDVAAWQPRDYPR